ncbi:MAG: hypothetical protein K0R70_343 [Steroidobacteraceae bacterium]|nr:hypothetical protein [Steroidobacteraceae bacterium]
MKPALRRLHRWIALTLGVLWLSQALTGLLMVYRWELDEAPLAGDAVPLDAASLGARIESIQADPAGRTVTSLWASGGVDGRFDLYVDDAQDNTEVVRVDGAGRVLRARASGDGFIPTAASLHQTLFSGDRGKFVVGVSGLFLLASIVIGLVLAWPARAKQWRQVLLPRGARAGVARRYAWHRAAGLWLGVPAVVMLGAGTTALAQFPGSELSGVAFPADGQPWYRIRVRQPAEWRRVYGTSVVYVAADDGRVLRTEDALDAETATAFMSNLYPVHTGEALGVAGRVLALTMALWLLTMLVLGVGLWLARRR